MIKVTFGRPGAREKFKEAQKYQFWRKKPIIATGNEVSFIPATLINEFGEGNKVPSAELSFEKLPEKSFKSVAACIKKSTSWSWQIC